MLINGLLARIVANLYLCGLWITAKHRSWTGNLVVQRSTPLQNILVIKITPLLAIKSVIVSVTVVGAVKSQDVFTVIVEHQIKLKMALFLSVIVPLTVLQNIVVNRALFLLAVHKNNFANWAELGPD